MKPLMNRHEIRRIERTLLYYGKTGKKVRVLEWGSGGSTVYFTKFMDEQSVPYLWRSMEYNKEWFEKVSDSLVGNPSVKLELFDVGNNVLRQRNIPMNEYVAYPSTLNEKFDVIIVDGRKRRRCLIEAKALLDEGGTVFLHDAQRRYYQCAFSLFPDQTFKGIFLWQGSNKKIGWIKRQLNFFQSLLMKMIFIFFVRPTQFILNHLLSKQKLTRDLLVQGDDLMTKIKIFFIAIIFALKKRNIPVFNLKFTLNLKNNKTITVSLSDYKSADEFTKYIKKQI